MLAVPHTRNRLDAGASNRWVNPSMAYTRLPCGDEPTPSWVGASSEPSEGMVSTAEPPKWARSGREQP